MNKNPKIKIKPTKFNLYIEIINYLLLVSFWLYIILAFKHLPEEIPTHYNGSGQVDAYGDKVTIFILPFIATITFIILIICAKKPHTINYTAEINLSNAAVHYQSAIKFIQTINLLALSVFIFIAYKTIQISLDKSESLGIWFLPIFAITSISIIGFNVYQYNKIK